MFWVGNLVIWHCPSSNPPTRTTFTLERAFSTLANPALIVCVFVCTAVLCFSKDELGGEGAEMDRALMCQSLRQIR